MYADLGFSVGAPDRPSYPSPAGRKQVQNRTSSQNYAPELLKLCRKMSGSACGSVKVGSRYWLWAESTPSRSRG
jgi:hypothetical protein